MAASNPGMIALIITTDAVKVSAIEALLRAEGIGAQVFDRQAGGVWSAIIPLRLMVADRDLDDARAALRRAGFAQAGDGDWDLRGA